MVVRRDEGGWDEMPRLLKKVIYKPDAAILDDEDNLSIPIDSMRPYPVVGQTVEVKGSEGGWDEVPRLVKRVIYRPSLAAMDDEESLLIPIDSIRPFPTGGFPTTRETPNGKK